MLEDRTSMFKNYSTNKFWKAEIIMGKAEVKYPAYLPIRQAGKALSGTMTFLRAAK